MRKSTYAWLIALAVVSWFWAHKPLSLAQSHWGCWHQLERLGAAVETYARVTGEYPSQLPVVGGCPLGGKVRYVRGLGERPYSLACTGPDQFRPSFGPMPSACPLR